MDTYLRAHLDDVSLERSFDGHVAQERGAIASLLADIAEIDARHLFLRSGFESMRAYCMQKLHLSEDRAAKRIQVARLARELPALFPPIADGRLHMTAVVLLASRLNRSNVEDWIAAAANKKVREIEVLIAHRCPQPEALRLDDGISPQPQIIVTQQLGENSHALKHASFSPSAPIAPHVRTKIAPLSPERYAFQTSLPRETHDLLREVQALLGHAVPSGDVVQVIHRALLISRGVLEKRKFGTGGNSRKPRPAATQRCIPARTRRAVYERDEGKCAFIHANGERCDSTNRLEFDHVQPRARGGKSTVENLRLVCRAHNQYEAERAFGRGFIEEKKLAARQHRS
jgi:hypothetical protein